MRIYVGHVSAFGKLVKERIKKSDVTMGPSREEIVACQVYLAAFDMTVAGAFGMIDTRTNTGPLKAKADEVMAMTKADAIKGGLACGGVAASVKAVPMAMSMFGKVVSGVGTLHASKAAGGLAATLQTSAFLPCLFGVSSGYLIYKVCSPLFKPFPKELTAEEKVRRAFNPELKKLALKCEDDYAAIMRSVKTACIQTGRSPPQ